ncbi:DMT family transporter [Cohnella hashimotonis]|uniref:Multidrug efflux SMR transporter n=1 Tax=Cohnella hashimotonis TaxID=2826895 RepID=A0ABT6TX69_9BACL|nr:multidrug efflux SMR transporter [Cohnella hashimotonis]MDI4650397.1 multidrug efflux SMR transporter [Cohnella hashimotonis]
MTKYWTLLIAAGVTEVGWVSGLKHASTWWEWLLTVVALAFSFWSLMEVTRVLPIGTAYAAFTGIGAAGTVIGEAVFYEGELNAAKLALVALMIVGIVGLKATSGPKSSTGVEKGGNG